MEIDGFRWVSMDFESSSSPCQQVWNVEWPEDPGVKYHHRVKKTRLMRDIVPAESSYEAKGWDYWSMVTSL